MQIAITRFGFNPSGWQTIIQQACLKTVEEESEKDKSAGLKNWEEGKENWLKKISWNQSRQKSEEEDKNRAGYQHFAWQAWQGNAESGFRTHLATTFDAIML